MKALSIKNPWGFLIAKGWKDVENRTWRTHYRGRILIHVSKKLDPIYKDIFFKSRYQLSDDQFDEMILELNNASTGCIIGEVDIVDVVENHPSVWSAKGQFQWVLKNPILYESKIVNVKGALGLWDYQQMNYLKPIPKSLPT